MQIGDRELKDLILEENCTWGNEWSFNGNSVVLVSNDHQCIDWADKQYKRFFEQNIVSRKNPVKIVAYYTDVIPFVNLNDGEFEECRMFLHKIGYKNQTHQNVFVMPGQYIHLYSSGVHKLLLSRQFSDNYRVPSRLMREILVQEGKKKLFRIHAACFVYNGAAYMLIGDKGAGKSTLLCNMLASGASFCANDRTLIFCEDEGINAFGLPVSVRLNRTMVACFPQLCGLESSALAFGDINKICVDKIEYTPQEIVTAFDVQIVNNIPVRGVVVPEFKKNKKIDVCKCENKLDILAKNTLMPDDAFCPYYNRYVTDQTNEIARSRLLNVPWINLRGDFYNLKVEELEAHLRWGE